MALVVLLFFSSVLLNIVDAVFMCYALDLDTQSVTKSEVHEVFSQVCSHTKDILTLMLMLMQLHAAVVCSSVKAAKVSRAACDALPCFQELSQCSQNSILNL